MLDCGRAAQEQIRHLTESIDNLDTAKKLLESKGMTVNAADVPPFKKLAEEKVWPKYQQQYTELWEQIVATKT